MTVPRQKYTFSLADSPRGLLSFVFVIRENDMIMYRPWRHVYCCNDVTFVVVIICIQFFSFVPLSLLSQSQRRHSMEWANFNPPSPQNRYPWTDRQKNRHSTSTKRFVYQIWYKFTDWGLLGKWVKYNKNYFLLFYLFIPFSEAGIQLRPVDGSVHVIALKAWSHSMMCFFEVIKLKFHIKPLLSPKPSPFRPKADKFFPTAI